MSRSILFDHDGGVDDLVALALLCSHKPFHLLGVITIDADCFVEPAHSAVRKMLALLNRTEVPCGKSTLKAVHPFPTEWRAHCINMNDMPVLNIPAYLEKLKPESDSKIAGEELMAKLVMESEKPVTICVTGPLSNIGYCIKKYGDKFSNNVESIVLMGGAVDVGGNVAPMYGGDDTAEWNIYWDAPSAGIVFQSDIKKVLFALDSTNHVPVNSAFVQRFGAQNQYLMSQFIGGAWSMCTHFEKIFDQYTHYYAWDALTAAFLLDHTIVDIEPVYIHLITEGASEGRTKRCEANHADAKLCYLTKNTKAEAFYSLTLKAFAQDF